MAINAQLAQPSEVSRRILLLDDRYEHVERLLTHFVEKHLTGSEIGLSEMEFKGRRTAFTVRLSVQPDAVNGVRSMPS